MTYGDDLDLHSKNKYDRDTNDDDNEDEMGKKSIGASKIVYVLEPTTDRKKRRKCSVHEGGGESDQVAHRATCLT